MREKIVHGLEHAFQVIGTFINQKLFSSGTYQQIQAETAAGVIDR